MYANSLSIKGLNPPIASGGLWRRWCWLLSDGVRRYPPKAFGGANRRTSKDLTNIRHLAAKREAGIIIFGGLSREDADKQALSEITVTMERLK